jgi:hypothetical protein
MVFPSLGKCQDSTSDYAVTAACHSFIICYALTFLQFNTNVSAMDSVLNKPKDNCEVGTVILMCSM